MADSSKKKKIAELYFKYDKAISGLKQINSELTNLSKTSSTVFKEIQKGLETSYSKKNLSGVSASIDITNKQLKAAVDVEKKRLVAENDANAKIRRARETHNLQMEKMEQQQNMWEERNAVTHAQKLEEIQTRQTKNSSSRLANLANTYLSYQGFAKIQSTIKDFVAEMANVEYSMVEIDRVLNEDSLNIQEYRDQLIQLAYDYGNSFENVADVTLRLAQAGFSSEEALALTEKTLLALNTAELDATQATSGLVAIMSQWGLMTGDVTEEAESYAKIIDEINMTADNFPTTSKDILEALKRSSSAFKLNGATIEETIATITAAEKATQRGGKVIGTAMNSIIQQLRDTGRMAKVEALGLDVFADAARTEFKPVMDIIGEMADKMNELTAAGKQNSQEMQDLQAVFSLFRRNIASSLMGEMDDGGTYQQVLDMLGENGEGALGYSLQENEKHLKTVKAAQEQFNATLLQLKTSVWENGVEDVYRSMLLLGNDLVKNLTTIIETFGALPTAIGAATLAYTNFAKNMDGSKKVQFFSADDLFGAKISTDKLKQIEQDVSIFTNNLENATSAGYDFSDEFKNYINTADDAAVTTDKVVASLKAQKEVSVAATVATQALNFALSAGLSVALSFFLSQLEKAIHFEENVTNKIKELNQEHVKETEQIEKTIGDLDNLIDKYKELSEQESTTESRTEMKNLQKEITDLMGDEAKGIDFVNGKYEDQAKILQELRKQKLTEEISSKSIDLQRSAVEEYGAEISLLKERKELLEGQIDSSRAIGDYIEAENYREELEKVNEQLEKLSEESEKAKEKLDWSEVNELTAEKMALTFAENIETMDDYRQAIEAINEMPLAPGFKGSLEEQQELIEYYLGQLFPEFEDSLTAIGYQAEYASEKFSAYAKEIESLSSQFDMCNKAVEEFNTTGAISATTFKNVADNGLLEWLDVVNGKLVVNKEHFESAADAATAKIAADLQERAAAEILNIVTADLNGTLAETKSSGEGAAAGVSSAATAAIDAANKFVKGAASALEFKSALDKLAGKQLSDISGISDNAKQQIANVTKELDRELKMINSLASGVTKASKAGSGAARSSGSAAKAVTKTFEEQSAERVKIFKKEIDDLEKLEQSWVNKYKKLELFSTSDLKFITHQRINRFNEYLNQINNLQGISEKDRTDLIREYSAKRQEAELEYFDLLKQQLDDQIKELENANKEKIKQIKDEAQAQIDALKKVDKENDKIKQKQEYERKRQELLYGNQGIEYWKQRTGREAQIALAKAEQELQELDEDWNEKKEGWNLDDQVEQIEKARDAQIAAIEDAQEKQIAGWKAAYDAQVQLYAQTGQIIYDNSVINAGYLYNAYMDNFVNPFNVKLAEVVNSLNTASAQADEVINKMNRVSGGGSATSSGSGIRTATTKSGKTTYAAPIGPTKEAHGQAGFLDSKILAQQAFNNRLLNNTIKNNLVKFHGGGIVNSQREGMALLRPNEAVLTPEWAAGLNKLVKKINDGDFNGNSSVSNQIDVSGNLVNIDANIKNKQDVDYLTERIEKVLKDKFNIRK